MKEPLTHPRKRTHAHTNTHTHTHTHHAPSPNLPKEDQHASKAGAHYACPLEGEEVEERHHATEEDANAGCKLLGEAWGEVGLKGLDNETASLQVDVREGVAIGWVHRTMA